MNSEKSFSEKYGLFFGALLVNIITVFVINVPNAVLWKKLLEALLGTVVICLGYTLYSLAGFFFLEFMKFLGKKISRLTVRLYPRLKARF